MNATIQGTCSAVGSRQAVVKTCQGKCVGISLCSIWRSLPMGAEMGRISTAVCPISATAVSATSH